jgi:hypothetical protein
MADLTLTVAVTTGTQYVTGDTGSIFTFDGSQPASFTFPWVEDGTVRLDQSGSSNDGHPLIFSTSNSETLGTMRAGIISSGVTYYLDGSSNESDYTNTTTFNAATTRYIEITPSAETDFYFACWVHGIGMGGIVDITETAWGAMSWGRGTWNDQEKITTGWGRLGWGDQSWGDSPTVALTGLSATTTLGTATASFYPGWGTLTWGQNGWGTITEGTVPITGISATTTLGTPIVGIGVPLTGLSAASTVGSPTASSDNTTTLTGESATSSLGSVNINIGVPLTGISGTITVGTPTARSYHTIALTGLSATTAVGSVSITSNPTVQPSGVSATSSVGAITPADQVMGLTGISATSAVGAITPADVMGLTGISATITLGTISPLHYKTDTITGNTSYTDVDITGYTAYTDDEHAA